MLVDSSRNLVPIEDVDPVRTPSLTDAALTPYQAIKSVLPRLVGGSTTVAIGAGGLGHVAIQRGQMRAVQLRADRPRRFTRVRPAGRTGYRRSLIGMTAHFAAMSVH